MQSLSQSQLKPQCDYSKEIPLEIDSENPSDDINVIQSEGNGVVAWKSQWWWLMILTDQIVISMRRREILIDY